MSEEMMATKTDVHKNDGWRAVVGYEGVYEVSPHGDVRRIRRSRGHFGPLKPRASTTRKMYFTVTLSDGPARSKSAYVHHLVAQAFIGDRPNGYEINHKDGNSRNNCATNLEYVTRQENVLHALEHGLTPRGEKASWSKLTEIEVVEIFNLRGKMPQRKIAAIYGVNQQAVAKIQLGQRWKHLGLSR